MSYDPTDYLSDQGYRFVFEKDHEGDDAARIIEEKSGDTCATFDGDGYRSVRESVPSEVELAAWAFLQGVQWARGAHLDRALAAEKELAALRSRVATFLEGFDGLRS